MFLLRPDDHTTAIINYCLAVAAKRYRINLIAWLFMSNHYHAVVHDPYAQIPAFTAYFHHMIAKALNHRWGRRENFWSSSETNLTVLPTHEDVLRKVVYVLTNPVKADLFNSVSDWPGASSWNYMDSKTRSHHRPAGYFAKKKKEPPVRRKVSRKQSPEMPARALLHAVPPPASMSGERAMCGDKWRRLVHDAVLEQEKTLRKTRRQEGRQLLKINVKTQEHTDSPSTVEPRNKVVPTLACRDRKLRRELREVHRHFLEEHERVRLLWAAGNYRTSFPVGTYRMRLLGARSKPPD